MFGSEPPTERCRCTHGSVCEAISVLGKKAKHGASAAQNIFERLPHAAVIIGVREVPLWKRMSQSSNSSTLLVPPAADHHASPSSSSQTGITTDAHLESIDIQHERSEESDSQSGDSVYISCEEG
jgi:hypothetical protein